MGRWTQYDEDAYRLPAGMVRTGYDADTGQYFFSDRSGTTYHGEPGSRYGPMYPGTAAPAPRRVVVDPEKTKTRATLPSMPSAFRSLRRSLTAVRNPWRRDHSSDSDDEGPVMVSRPSTPVSRPGPSIDTPIYARYATLPTSSPPLPPKSVQGASTVSKPSKRTGNARHTRSVTLPSSPPLPPPKPVQGTFTTATASSTRASKAASLIVTPSRSASTSAGRSSWSGRRAASEHVHASRSPNSTSTVIPTDGISKHSSQTATGLAPTSQKIPSKRPASEQTSSSEKTSSSSASAASRPRTSAQLSRSLSITEEAPSTSQTMTMAMAPAT
ncbi:hypothetical protein DFH07DRAFT_807717 [Mycena maculata]|uniref:Uncharacterized protein n=1 Tax=Mycena maculata TaxID=230809 RepID=A0AAD7NPD4_9AGAR|nr:hypothetical protein DFH07DRAFT_807717 [Mycena maculata]